MIADGRDALFEGPSEQDITIARVVLAGWRIERVVCKTVPQNYQLFTPSGRFAGEFSTRLGAAQAAEFAMAEPAMRPGEGYYAARLAIALWRSEDVRGA